MQIDRLPYKTIFGGVGGMSLEQLQKTNGFSNMFWGWGGEDDDMYNRLHHNKYQIMRYPQNIARYTMMTHKKETPSPQRFKFLYGGMKRYKTDGLNSLVYERVDLKLKKLYTLVQVNIKKADVMKNG
ncbi:Beta-1,4-N-acetylgalactosaminyltransferase bre-4 [Nymphon striatum]|nr:Beta-1,4-N-acetylgalactosaminyltransferase bre-4 [Nymphon striatum]